MANLDRPSGFKAVSGAGGSAAIPMYPAKVRIGVSLQPGDAIIMLSNGTVDIALAASTQILGVCQSVVTGGAALVDCLYVPARADIVFEGQCSGTYTPVNAGESVDIEGATGVMEINENAQITGVARIIKLADGIDNADGANARVLFNWTKSQWTGQSS